MALHVLRVAKLCVALLLAVGLSACANLPRNQAPPRPIIDGLDISMINTVFVRGFGEIKEHAFQDPDLDTLFVAALTGLNTIEPQLKTEKIGENVVVTYGERKVAEIPPKARGDVPEWSLVALRTILAARKTSQKLKEADADALYKAMFTSALARIDPYSRYAPREAAMRNRLVRDGVIGLGVRVEMEDEGAWIRSLVFEGPSELAGLKIGDTIITANGTPLAGLSLPQARRRLDGVIGTSLTLTVRRPGLPEPMTVIAALDLVVPDTVTATYTDGVLALHVRSFNQRTTYAVEKAINTALADKSQAFKGVVLDLRGDPGGLFDQAIEVADLFLETGTIATLHGRHPGANQYYAAKRGDITNGAPVAVIMDGKSASAAEIVAAALQDNHRAAIVGTVTWGKGSVQTLRRLPNGGEFALTWARVIAPRGIELHGLGLMPDICLNGTATSVSDVVDTLYGDTRAADEVRRRWRTAADDINVHETLRMDCPAEVRDGSAVDLEVARRVVSDQALFAIALRDDTPQLAVKP